MKNLILATALSFAATAGAYAAEEYTLDTSHSQVVFSYNHLGFSTTFGLFSDITGTIMFDEADPAKSSVEVTLPVSSMETGYADRDAHFTSGDFLGKAEDMTATFTSTAIEVTGENTAIITGDLSLNGVTIPVELDTTMTQKGDHPMANKPWLGFYATGTVKRTEVEAGQYAPYVGDDVSLIISIEAMKAE
ncbi:MAG: YceI family protein [Mangrovicoccus sp.]